MLKAVALLGLAAVVVYGIALAVTDALLSVDDAMEDLFQ